MPGMHRLRDWFWLAYSSAPLSALWVYLLRCLFGCADNKRNGAPGYANASNLVYFCIFFDFMHWFSNECTEELMEEEMVVELPADIALGPSLLCGVSRPSRILACVDHTILHDVVLRHPSESGQIADMSASVCSADTESSTLRACPVCSQNLAGMGDCRAQQHVSKCLDRRRSSVIGTTYTSMAYANHHILTILGSKISADVEGKECGICFEAFHAGQECATLNCLCMFHRHCIENWFRQKRACPLHFD